jgi:hypothetical protein
MQAATDRIMQAFTMMANLTAEEVQATRERLTAHLAGMDVDEKALAVEGLRYLRGNLTGCPSEGSRGKPDDG